MPATSNDSDLWVSYDEYHHMLEALALLVHQSGWQFDQVLCLARGGLRPGDVLARIFKVPLAILSTSSYREAAGTSQGNLDIAKSITMTGGSLSGKVLLVDDLVDTGVTLKRVQRHIIDEFPDVTEIKSAVIWCKASTSVKPDFCLEYLASNPWIHQPFEEYDSLSLQQLMDRMNKAN